MQAKTKTRRWNGAPKASTGLDQDIVAQNYERGCKFAAWLMAGMFAFMSWGAVVLGW